MSIDFRLKNFFFPWAILKKKREFDRNQWLSPDQWKGSSPSGAAKASLWIAAWLEQGIVFGFVG